MEADAEETGSAGLAAETRRDAVGAERLATHGFSLGTRRRHDGWKLANWDEYAGTVNTEDPPETADNRLGAATSPADQTRRALTRLIP